MARQAASDRFVVLPRATLAANVQFYLYRILRVICVVLSAVTLCQQNNVLLRNSSVTGNSLSLSKTSYSRYNTSARRKDRQALHQDSGQNTYTGFLVLNVLLIHSVYSQWMTVVVVVVVVVCSKMMDWYNKKTNICNMNKIKMGHFRYVFFQPVSWFSTESSEHSGPWLSQLKIKKS